MIDESIETAETASQRLIAEAGEPWMTRRDLFCGVGQVAIAGMGASSLALLGACATPQQEPWADGTFWADGTGWIE